MESEVTTGDMLAHIADEGGSDSVKLIGNLLEGNRREAEWLANTIQTGLERERDEWKDRAIAAEDRLRRIELRLFSLLD